MTTTLLEIIAKIQKLPPDFAEHVHWSKGNTAEVDSFSDPVAAPYTVAIKYTKEETEGLRDVVCSCAATKLCNHIVAYYAVAKNLKPSIKAPGPAPPSKVDKEHKGKTGEVRQSTHKKRAELYDQISAAFNDISETFDELAELEDK